ncbi:MAG: sugar ABC transporter substrate-binding protein [Chloroflexi bacterium]|nr:sugar ABC transporter substrate-binding protein [Chloroflexota bacterium]
MSSQRWSRRVARRQVMQGVIGLSAFTALAGLLAACGQQPVPTPTPPPAKPAAAPPQPPPTQAAAKPTVAPTPAAKPAGGTAGPVKLVQWDSNPAPARTQAYKYAAQKFIKEYTRENPSVSIEIEYVPVPIANYQEKLTAAITAGTPPDVGDIWFNWIAQYVGMKALLSLEPYLPLWKSFKDYSPAYLRLSRFLDNTAYLITWDIFYQGTHYRKDLIKEAGVEDPRELDKQGKWDWAAFGKVARALHKPEKNIYGVSLRGGVGADFTIFNLVVAANKGKWFDDSGNCLLNTPAAVAALEWYTGLHTDLKVTQPSAPSDGFQEFTNVFFNGLAGMMIHNDDGISGLVTLGREKYATANMPASPAGMYMGLVGFGFAVLAATRSPEIAARYVFHSIEHGVENSLENAEQLGQKVQIMTIAPMLGDMKRDILKDPLYEAFYDVPNNHPERTFVNPYWLPEYAGLTAQLVVPDFQKILTGKMKSKEAADRWAAEFTKAQQAYLKARK